MVSVPDVSSLAASLLAHAEGGLGDELRAVEDLEGVLAGLVAKARAAWPDVEVADDAFLRHIAAVLGTAEALPTLWAADLYLALACAQGHPRALGHFDRTFLKPASMHVRSAKMSHVDPADVEQLLREKLFVADAANHRLAKISTYAGRGPLAAWVRVAATRVALSLQRSATTKGHDADMEALYTFAAADNPELDHVRATYTDAFRLAFHDALADLTSEERNVLRLSIVDHLPAEAIARVFSVHRATVTRRIACARDALFDGMRRRLAERLQLNQAEFESVMGVLLSEFDVSVQRVLAEMKSTV